MYVYLAKPIVRLRTNKNEAIAKFMTTKLAGYRALTSENVVNAAKESVSDAA